MPTSHELRPLGLRDVVVASALYALATILCTWPLFAHPATTVLETRALYGGFGPTLIQRDINLTMWVLAWDTHALLHDPGRLFHANAFHPAPWSLALSEHMLGNLPLFAPVYLLTGNPVFAHQTTLCASFVLSGLAMAAYVFSWTRDRGAAFAAGLVFAFAPTRLWQLGSLHVISVQYLPLVLLAIDRIVAGRTRWWASAGLAAALALSCGCSYYVGYAAFLLAATYATAVVLARRAWPALFPLAMAAGLAALVVVPLTLPYLALQRSGVLPTYGAGGQTSLAFLGMLKFGALKLIGWFGWPRRDGIPQFLTWTALALALMGIARHRGSPRGALVAVVVVGVVVSLGPYAILPWMPVPIPMPYRVLAAVVPGFSAMRAPQRIGMLATVGTMALAGFGLAWARGRLRAAGRARAAAVLPLVVMAMVVVEGRPWRIAARPMRVGAAVPPAYAWLATHGDDGPLLELPIRRVDLHRESLYMYYSTYHWLPLLNGYSSYPPSSWRTLAEAAGALPAPAALERVLAHGPRWVLLHRDGLLPGEVPQWEAALSARLRRVHDFGDAVLYEHPGAGGDV